MTREEILIPTNNQTKSTLHDAHAQSMHTRSQQKQQLTANDSQPVLPMSESNGPDCTEAKHERHREREEERKVRWSGPTATTTIWLGVMPSK